jgi:hypothetical protein
MLGKQNDSKPLSVTELLSSVDQKSWENGSFKLPTFEVNRK